ncbi:MAG: Holliday junction branch migration protein RuvA [Acholeplasmataceae bacterium]|jgi:Holliday junction DNA helicase RuvA|nr:Holliday junction branch migration protein RuvA [Acholeplasmataceae bacterium]
MYGYIKGVIKGVEPTFVIIENNDIGYLVITPNSYRYQLENEVTIFTHHYVRQDINNLYGFLSKEERDLFIKLISVSGIGPKSALSILASGEPDKIIYAIEVEDVKYLTKFPGIGPKSAQQIILDLKGKLAKEVVIINLQTSEVIEALSSLGYSRTEINKAIKRIDNTLPIEEMIKQALAFLIK